MLPFILALSLAGVDAAQLADSLQKKYDGIKDFSADFIHTYEGGVLRKKITERGISFVAFDDRGQPIRTAYAANIFAPQPRFVVRR